MATSTTFNKAQHALWNNQMAGFIKKIEETITPADCVDSDTTGTYTFDADLPADCIVIGWKAVTTAAWDDDTSATIQVGIAGTLDLYSAATTASIATTGTVGQLCKTLPSYFQEAAASPVVTITGTSDFTAFVTAGTPSTTVSIYYIELN